jgi:hypothetical protein
MYTDGGRSLGGGLASVGVVTARIPSKQAGSTEMAGGRGLASSGWTSLPPQLRSALGIAVLGGLALALGPLLAVVSPATPAGFSSGPLLFVTGLLPVAVAAAFALRGRALAAGGALIAAALFAPGRALADLQLAVDSTTTARPELTLPQSVAAVHGGFGLWLLLAGHVLTLVGGVLAIWYAGMAERDHRVDPGRPGSQQGPVILGLCFGVLAAVGLVAEPFTSTDPYLVARDVLDGAPLTLVGGLLIAIAVPVIGTLVMAAVDPVAVRGWLFGAAAAVLAVALPPLVAGLAVPALDPSIGPYLAVAGALALVVLGVVRGRSEAATDEPVETVGTVNPAELELPGQGRLHLATGLIGLLAGVAALVGALTSLYVLPANLPHPSSVAGRPLVPAGLLIGLLGAAMLRPRWAAVVRPAFAVAWVAVVLAGLDAVDTTLTATQIAGVTVGFGSWATVLAIVAAVVAACCAGVAGGVERDDVDLTEVRPRTAAFGPAAAGVLLAIGAFGLPVLQGGGFAEPGLWSNFTVESWGLLLGLIAVAAAAVLAPMSRPNRGAALLLGAAGVLLVRALELPLTRASAPGSTAGPGFWLALAAIVALVIGAVTVVATGRRPATASSRRS